MLKRLNYLKRKFELSEIEPKPDFDNMTEQELDVYIKRVLEEQHRENGIQSYEMAKDELLFELSNDLISKQEFELMLEGEKMYWNKLKEVDDA